MDSHGLELIGRQIEHIHLSEIVHAVSKVNRINVENLQAIVADIQRVKCQMLEKMQRFEAAMAQIDDVHVQVFLVRVKKVDDEIAGHRARHGQKLQRSVVGHEMDGESIQMLVFAQIHESQSIVDIDVDEVDRRNFANFDSFEVSTGNEIMGRDRRERA